MEIFAKAAMLFNQIESKIKIGCDGIEIQLLDELVFKDGSNYYDITDIFTLDKFSHYPVRAVHAPILSNFGLGDINIENFTSPVHFKLLENCFKLANFFGEIQDCRVIIVVHSEMSKDSMQNIGTIWDDMVKMLGDLLYKYQYTEVAIENVTPLRIGRKLCIGLCNGFYQDNISIVDELRRTLNTDRIGTVLDTCHAIITKGYLDALYGMLDKSNFVIPSFDLDTYFKANKGVVKLIHLCDAKGDGYSGGNHGIAFSEENENLDTLKSIIDLYNFYEYSCPITLEVGETDFIGSPNYEVTYNNLVKLLQS